MENTGQKHRPHIKVGKDVDEEEEEAPSVLENNNRASY